MTVKELIELLKQEYQDAEFQIVDQHGNYFEPISLDCSIDFDTREAHVNIRITA